MCLHCWLTDACRDLANSRSHAYTHARSQIQAIVNGMKPLKRERKNSTSSSASSISAHSTSYQAPRFQQNKRSGTGRQHSAPFRAASDPEISMATRSSSTPVGKPWPTTLPSTTVSLFLPPSDTVLLKSALINPWTMYFGKKIITNVHYVL